jgi:uracil-DNA glycosylase
MFQDTPKLLGDKEALNARLNQIEDSHVAPLTKLVRHLRESMGVEAKIPYFDPWDGGVEAEVLFLLEAPGAKAINTSFVSRNNPDETAKNLFELSKEASIHRKRTVIWNIVPWYIGTGERIRAANSADIEKGGESLPRLIRLLPKLKLVVLFGVKAQKAEYKIKEINPKLEVFCCPHPSPLYVNRAPENRNVILETLQASKALLSKL